MLDVWNARTSQSLSARDWLAMIVRRQRERPELELADHVDAIDAVLAAPWWNGAPSPNIIYGSAAQWERSLAEVAHRKSSGDELAEKRSRFTRMLGGGA